MEGTRDGYRGFDKITETDLEYADWETFSSGQKFAEMREKMNNNSNSTSKMQVPEAKEAMNRFKMEVASELNVPLKEGYNGNLTSAQNGSVGGEMVRQMIKKQEESMSGSAQ